MGSGGLQPPILPQPRFNQSFTSARFQWLPADVVVDSSGGVKFLSYINNVHPEWHAPLYPATAALLQRTIPLFERVLAESAAPKVRAILGPWPHSFWEPDEDAWYNAWCIRKKEEDPEWGGDPYLTAEEEDELWKQERKFQEPKVPEEFVAPPTPPAVSLRGRTLQVRPLPSPEREHFAFSIHRANRKIHQHGVAEVLCVVHGMPCAWQEGCRGAGDCQVRVHRADTGGSRVQGGRLARGGDEEREHCGFCYCLLKM